MSNLKTLAAVVLLLVTLGVPSTAQERPPGAATFVTLLDRAGFKYSKLSDNVWELPATGQNVKSFAIKLILVDDVLLAFAKIGDRTQLRLDPPMLTKLMEMNHGFDMVKLALSEEMLYLRMDAHLRLLDERELKYIVEQIANATDETVAAIGRLQTSSQPAEPGSAPANETAAVMNLRTINTAEVIYLSAFGGAYGDLAALIGAGLLDTRFTGTVSGYRFSITARGADYTATAIPASSTAGRYGFFSIPDGVVRYSNSENLAPPGQKGNPVVSTSPAPARSAPSNETAAVMNLRTINTAEVTYLSSSGGNYGSMAAMISAGLLDSRFTGTLSGYNYSITVSDDDYTATATPASSNAGRYGFFSTPDGVVWYSNSQNLAPPGQTGHPVD